MSFADGPRSQGFPVVLISLLLLVATVVVLAFLRPTLIMPEKLLSYLRFIYGSFLKPHTGDADGNQQDALESFYEFQAPAYDATRTTLLRGRDDMIELAAAQLKHKNAAQKPIWVDIGGGTGWNIEQMGRYVDVPTYFHKVYLVDLSTSLLKIAQARFDRLGWTNVKLVCIDCRNFDLGEYEDSSSVDGKEARRADLITMSYSLTMIPEYYSVIDSIVKLLDPHGMIAVVDFYAQGKVEFSGRNYAGGLLDRHCAYANRTFWRAWFDLDRVWLDSGRRDYLEYQFGTRLNANFRNAMVPGIRIPYYIWIGCAKSAASASLGSALAKEVEPNHKAYSLPSPSVFYQNHSWRVYYDDRLRKYTQFKAESLPSFAKAGTRVPAEILSVQPNDVVFAPTNTGDLILSLAVQRPQAIYAVALDPRQNHLLELKLAAFLALGHNDITSLFGQGSEPNFRALLMDKLSPHMSSHAFQFWLRQLMSSAGLFHTGHTRRPAALAQNLHTDFLRADSHKELSQSGLFDKLWIYTDELSEVVAEVGANTFTLAVLDDTMSSFDSEGPEADAFILGLNRSMSMKGRVLLKASEPRPWYIPKFEQGGFEAQRHDLVDPVIWTCTKARDAPK